MNEDIENLLLLLECTLINEENPDYIEVSFSQEHNTIYILLSKPDYINYKIHERIQGVFALLSFEHSEIINEIPMIIECLTPTELDDMFKTYNKE